MMKTAMPMTLAAMMGATSQRITFLYDRERVNTLVIWNVATLFIATILWKTVGLKNMEKDGKPPPQTWQNAFYNALSTQFAFAGVGDWTPANDLGRWILIFNIIMGLFNIVWIVG